ncbi:MAG: metalloregulator ArsR/SmtB family transcription factor [Vicinamibacteria bacterium]|jgi:DNA-binding transcriptional ArsR family regulator|nr:metalloregulator ArsR/SmtB family transcription factor [Vicinamibacteria bacterium]
MLHPELIPRVAERFKALADPVRLRLLSALMERERTVGELAEMCGKRQPNVSQQLAALAHAGLVAGRKEGQRVYYRIADPYIARICGAVCEGLAHEARSEEPIRRKLSRRASQGGEVARG